MSKNKRERKRAGYSAAALQGAGALLGLGGEGMEERPPVPPPNPCPSL